MVKRLLPFVRVTLGVSFVFCGALPARAEPPPAEDPPQRGVVVQGKRPPPNEVVLRAAEARETPGALGDPLRAIDTVPGVVPVRTATPMFFLRGAPPNDTAFFVDGVRVPYVFHAGLGPSVVQPELLERVEVQSSVVPLRYGDVAGGSVTATMLPPADHQRAEAAVRLVDASATAESPFARGRGSVLLAARYGFPNLMLDAVAPSTRLAYWDYQTRGSYDLDARTKFTLLALGSSDQSSVVQKLPHSTVVEELLASRYHVADLRIDHTLGLWGELSAAATVGMTSSGASPLYATDEIAGARIDLDAHPSSAVTVRGGLDARFDHFDLERKDALGSTPVPSSADPPPKDTRLGGYVGMAARASRRVDVNIGARVDLYASERDSSALVLPVNTLRPAFDPRLSARAELREGVWWVGSVGLAHQYPSLRVSPAEASIAFVPGFSDSSAPLQSSYQMSQGIGFRLPEHVVLSTTAFLSRTFGETDLTGECARTGSSPFGATTGYVCSDSPVSSTARGIEILVRHSSSTGLSGFISYTLSRTTRQAHVSVVGRDVVETVPGDYDRAHVLNAAALMNAGRNWRVGARAAFYSGRPYWPGAPGTTPDVHRYPAFFRLDLRAEKRWSLGDGGFIALSFEVQNATLGSDVTGVSCIPGASGRVGCAFDRSTVVIPIVGLEIATDGGSS